MIYPDIYFLPEWGSLNARLENGEFASFRYDFGGGSVWYPFIIRPIDLRPGGGEYYDIVTPYGFNGPVVTGTSGGGAAAAFEDAFGEYCEARRIVAEYVRFSPWLNNHQDFKELYNLRYNNYTLGTALGGDFFMSEFSSKCRNQVRKAQKCGVEIAFDYTGESLSGFCRLYDVMADKNQIGPAYRFSQEYFEDTFRLMAGRVFLINAFFDGVLVSSAVFLHHGEYMHYHFSGNDPEYYSLCANSLILYRACAWGAENGKKTLHLGGAFSESLFHFKKQFTKNGVYDYYVGTRIRNRAVYDELVSLRGNPNPDYFPAYR